MLGTVIYVLGTVIYVMGASLLVYLAFFQKDSYLDSNDLSPIQTLVGIIFVFLGSVLLARARTRSEELKQRENERSNDSI